MIAKYIYILVAVGCVLQFCNCIKQPKTAEVVAIEPLPTITADDTSRINIYADIPWQAANDTVVFTAIRGTFVGGTTIAGGFSIVSQPANISNHKMHNWTATAVYIAPLTSGSDTITAYIQGLTPAFIDTMPVNLIASVPYDSIVLSLSASAVMTNYGTTAVITGALTNQSGFGVSLNTPVTFTLFGPLPGNTQLTGSQLDGAFFSPATALSNQSSQVTTTFNPGTLATGAYIIKATAGAVSGTTVIYVQ